MVKERDFFISKNPSSELLLSKKNTPLPSALYGFAADSPLCLDNAGHTYFGFVYEGPTVVRMQHNTYTLCAGQYFAAAEPCVIEGGRGMVSARLNYKGLNCIGGPLEKTGRLRYIDGCTDTLLISPPQIGDPCFNALYFPENTKQTPHTHPSVRMGMVVSGKGFCVLKDREVPLLPGAVFAIHEESLHSFRTEDSRLTVVAYHPDSDFGPKHEDHPMINRTIIDGESASAL